MKKAMKAIDITKEILPIELDSLFDTVEYENYGIFKIDKVVFENNLIEFYFTIKILEELLDEGEENYQWKLKITDCKDYHIEDSTNVEASISVFSEHVLLSHYQKSWKELFFKQEGTNLNQLFVDLYNLHHFDFEYFIVPEKYLANDKLSFLVNSESGLFARGPEDILDLYFNLLLKYGKEPYYFQNNIKMDDKKKDELKIVFLGNNYFIGKQLEFQKL
ncbi:hypothetical protein [Chryseobacterium caseinilyticum]|uniref:DUF4261 domain-containing protein n=1 Tax=Chryseobacterium caseinilyticum TaxID=2771428 RepID=A0ABR8ZHA9_9FLAO|nr:hypothetical protein [Chryseobacterium caseinilyticum]MBD8084178.1 hypothetical protein [Chryseobacterium caseinilyticum]